MSGYVSTIGVPATVDLSALQWRAIAIGGTLAATSQLTIGLLANKPQSGDDASLNFMGRSKFAAGATILAGASLSVTNSGWLITTAVASGNSTLIVGKSEFAVVSGGVGNGLFNFTGGTLVAFD